jgi:hypothetical protein
MFAVMKTFVTDISASTGRNDFIFDSGFGTRYKSPCQNHVSNIKSFLLVEAEISVTKVFITANMKNSKSRGKQVVDVHLLPAYRAT